MISEGDIFLFRFPQTDLAIGKLRPALIIRQVGEVFDDWLICMISTRIKHQIPDLEMVIDPSQKDFAITGLKKPSLLRTSRLAVIQGKNLEGKIGSLPSHQFEILREKLANWIRGTHPDEKS